MPYTPHVEQHFTGGLVVRDTVIGMSDGLTVPFALAAGITGAVDSTTLVVTAGLAEIAAGSIAMGLGGFMAGEGGGQPHRGGRGRGQQEDQPKTGGEGVGGGGRVWGPGRTPDGGAPGAPAARSALQTLLVGGLAAGAAFLIARAIS